MVSLQAVMATVRGSRQDNNGYAPRGGGYGQQQYGQPQTPDFMSVPAGMDEEIPFN